MKLNKNKSFEVTDTRDFVNKLKLFSRANKGVHTASVVFGTVFVKTFAFPSQVGLSQVDDSPVGHKGFGRMVNSIPLLKNL